jgi:uncharacterized protein (DUF849 family)
MEKRNRNNLIVSCCLSGAGTTKEMAPSVPIHPDEIAADVVCVVKAGAKSSHPLSVYYACSRRDARHSQEPGLSC